mgnify:CR=1 FL=1
MFECPVTFTYADGSSSAGRVDCYRRGSFVAESKKLKSSVDSERFSRTLREAHAQAQHIEPAALLQARLFPDMFPLLKQVQIAADFARGVSARLAGVAVPGSEGQEKSFADLTAMLDESLVFLDSLQAAQFDGSDKREIVLRPGTPKERKFSGQAYLAHYGLPQFFFLDVRHFRMRARFIRHHGILNAPAMRVD